MSMGATRPGDPGDLAPAPQGTRPVGRRWACRARRRGRSVDESCTSPG